MSQQSGKPPDHKGSLLMTMRAVAWSCFGVRRSAGHAQDVARLNPVHLVLTGIIAAGVFVVSLVLLVEWVVGSGVAG